MDGCAVVTPWVREEQLQLFLRAWGIEPGQIPAWLVLQRDEHREGCGATKNKGIARAMELGADTVVILDDDCFPSEEAPDLPALMKAHVAALRLQSIQTFEVVTDPPSRGTPYFQLCQQVPIAASMGFWTEIGDYCAVRGLAHQNGPMVHKRRAILGGYFPLCGMNLAFRPKEWLPWCRFIEVPRFDDIWMGWLWQRHASDLGFAFNLAGPLIRHSRQSNGLGEPARGGRSP